MRIASLFVLLLCSLRPAQAAEPSLAGDWIVELSTDPATPYTKPMQLILLPDGGVRGRFYDSDIQDGQWKLDRGRNCASFRTSDGAGPYHTAVCLGGDAATAAGQTWAEHRGFLFNWNAVRGPADP
jgi:hypothetical protein